MNNGQKKSLIIYENDNVEQKVNEFCLSNRISPSDKEVLLQRVKEEFETKSSNSKTVIFKFDSISNNNNIEEPKIRQQINNNFMDYVPEEKKRLDQILNESDSLSISQSLKKSSINLDDLINEYKNDDNEQKEKTLERSSIMGKTSKAITIKNDLNKSVNPTINNSKQPKLFSNENLMNSIKNDSNLNNSNKPTIIKSDYNNLKNNINKKDIIPNKEINKHNTYYGKNNNQLLFNNSGLNKTQTNNTCQNISNISNQILPLNNNNNYTQGNIYPLTTITNQKFESLEPYNNNINIKNNIISSPKTQPKTIIYNTIQNENSVKYNKIENPKIGTIVSNKNKAIFQNNYYNYETKTFSNNQSNPNIYNFHSNDIYNPKNNVNKNESIVFNYDQGQYTKLNNINSNHIITDINNPHYVNINYDKLISQNNINYDYNTQSDKYDIVNQIKYSTYENMNLQQFNTIFDKANTQILKYNNNGILNNQTLNDELKYQKANYQNSPNVFSNQNSQFHIYQNIQSPKSLKNNDYVNGLNNQKGEKPDEIKKVKVLKLENFNSNLNQNKSNILNDASCLNNNIVKNMNYNNKNLILNENTNTNKKIINNSNTTTLNGNLNKRPNLLINNINNSNDNKKNTVINHKINSNQKIIGLPINKTNNNGFNETNKNSIILNNKFEEKERKINTKIEILSNYNKNSNMTRKKEESINNINNVNIKENSIKNNNEKNEENNEEKEPQDNYKKKKKKRSDLPKDTDETQTQYDISVISNNNITNLSNHESNISKINISEINNSKNNISKNNINRSKINNSIYNNKNQSKNMQKNNNNKNLFINLSQNEIKEEESNTSNKKENNIININKDNSSYNESESMNENSIGNINFEKYLDRELDNKKPRYKKIINLENSDSSSQSQSLQSSKIKKYSKNTFQQKNNKRNKPMKILTFKNSEFNSNNINKRSNSSGANKNRNNISRNNLSGERLYEQYKIQLQRREELKKRILEERTGNRYLSPIPRIDPNSRRIVEKMRSNKRDNKIGESSINYGYNSRQKNLIEKSNNNKIKSPFKDRIDKKSSSIINKNKKDRISKSIDIIKDKKRRIKYKKIDLNKELGKRNRSIGNGHSKKDDFINFEDQKNDNQKTNNSYLKRNNKNAYKKNSNDITEKNYNLNSYRNQKYESNSLIDESKSILNQLNNANKEDEKDENDITKYFGHYGADLNSNLAENNIYSRNHSSDIKNKNLQNSKRSLTPPAYKAFDYLYYESENQEEKRKKQEVNSKRNYPFNPRISPNKKKESKNQFTNRTSKYVEEMIIVNKSKINRNNKSNFQPKINRENEREKADQEKNNIYNKKNKDNIMKIKLQKYKELFSLLDSNNDGFISNTEIKLTKVDKGVLRSISPLLEELKQTKKRMNFKEFCLKVDKLMNEEK